MPYFTVSFHVTLSNLAKFSTIVISVARPLCDSWASCIYRFLHGSS